MNNIPPLSTVIIINNSGGRILPSETFFTEHINKLSPPVVPLIGIPGHRILVNHGHKKIPSRSFIMRLIRLILRTLKISTIGKQDQRAVSKFLKKYRVKVVIAEYGPTAVSVMDACLQANVPLIAHFHGFDAYTNEVLEVYKNKYQKLFDSAKAIIAVSNHMKNQLISLGAIPNKTFVNACGANVPKDITANPRSAELRFLMVGRLVEKKAPFLSIIAFAKVVEKYPQAILDIIGEGQLSGVCHQIANGLGLSKNVKFHGAQSHDTVFSMMSKSRCFIQHSVCTPNNDHEGTPVGVLEAMGMGLPVVATRHGGISDVIEDGVTGSLVDEYDTQSMADAMLRYAGDPEYSQLIGSAARESIQQNHTSTISINNLQNIINTSLAAN